MSLSIGKAAPAVTAPAQETPAKTKEAGLQFEAIFVRQMLGSAGVAGHGGFAEMAVDAVATAVTAAGGLGLGRAIAQSIDKARITFEKQEDK
jgi:hypothetical protein